MSMSRILYWALAVILNLTPASANVEKAIFIAPSSISIPTAHPNLEDLLVDSLSSSGPSLRTQLNASFPSASSPKGTESWLLLEDLNPGQRYEVRICWLATQPTSFWIYAWQLSEVFETPSLITSLSMYSYARLELPDMPRPRPPSSSQDRAEETSQSLLFLQIFAAADYFTLDKTLMETVPPVDVDLILDPYLLNVFPKSLVPTAVYICVLAVLGWVLADWVWRGLLKVVAKSETEERSGEMDSEPKKKV